MRYKEHPPHWDMYIKGFLFICLFVFLCIYLFPYLFIYILLYFSPPTLVTSSGLIHLWLIWNTNSHSYNAYFNSANNITSNYNSDDSSSDKIPVGDSYGFAIFLFTCFFFFIVTEEEEEDLPPPIYYNLSIPYQELPRSEGENLGLFHNGKIIFY
jgi:hypothetical protein